MRRWWPMSYFASTPQGFFRANEYLNALPEATLQEMVDETLDVLSWKVGEISSSKYVNAASQIKATTGLSVQERVESMLNALQFIFRGAIADKLDGAEALQAVLRKHADLSDAARKVISETWGKRSANGTLNSSSSSSASSSSSSSTLQTGQLLRLDWKLGVGIRSSKCKALKAPFVAMNFNVADPTGGSSGKIASHLMELSLSDLAQLKQAFQEIAAQLESI